MRADIPELIFPRREEFRAWLHENSETSEGVYLVIGKRRSVKTLSANDALEEALCFGWIDGQMRRIDNTKYIKYFAKRRKNSLWSEKNKEAIQKLRDKGIMTSLGESAVEAAMKNGKWDEQKPTPITDDEVKAFVEKFSGISPAYENLLNMSKSVQRTYLKRNQSFKSEESRQRDFERIVERLNMNLKPM